MEMNSIETLLAEQLRDLYSAEGQLLKALPKMARKASNESLREAFENHLEETKVHVSRLQEIGASLGIKLGGHKCKAMEGLIEEGGEMLEAEGDDAVVDAGLVAAAQRVEHYEISAYGTARALAEKVGEQQVAELLGQTLDEESAADKKLTQICEGELLPNAKSRADSRDGGDDTGADAPGKESRAHRSRASTGRTANSRAGKGGKARGASAPSKRGAGSGSRSGSASPAGGPGLGRKRGAAGGARGSRARSGSGR